jgi:hypothetical protein
MAGELEWRQNESTKQWYWFLGCKACLQSLQMTNGGPAAWHTHLWVLSMLDSGSMVLTQTFPGIARPTNVWSTLPIMVRPFSCASPEASGPSPSS